MLGLSEEPPQAATATVHARPIAAARIRDLVIAQFNAAADNRGVTRLRRRLWAGACYPVSSDQQRPQLLDHAYGAGGARTAA